MRLIAFAVAAGLIVIGSGAGAASAAPPEEGQRDVLLVANGADGMVDLIDQHGLKRVGRIDAAPDYRECVASATPQEAAAACVADNQLAVEGTLTLLDDVRASPDGRTLYVSRPSLGDVAAFSLRTEELLWRVEVSGKWPDHLALSPDGTRLLVSARSADVVEAIDTRSAAIVDRFPTGDAPHGNEYSEDGKLVYNGSIGRRTGADSPPCRCFLTIANGATMDVERVIDFGHGVRPFVVMPNGNRAYIQLTFLHGFVEYSLAQERIVETVELPVAEGATLLDPSADSRASTNHGIALSPDHAKICAAATASNYAAVVRRRSLTVKGMTPVGDVPGWATSSDDGRYCFVANRATDDISVISYAQAEEVARIETGDRPMRMRTATVRLR